MPTSFNPIAMRAPVTRAIAISALLGATLLAGPPAARAQTATPPAAPPASQTPAARAEAQAETVEQRIANLHTQLQITAPQEAKWQAVAQAMRDNAAAMEKMAKESEQQATNGMTAVDDLKTYEKFARAHVAGLRKLTASFEVLYGAMPAPQKKIADQVFDQFGHQPGSNSAHS